MAAKTSSMPYPRIRDDRVGYLVPPDPHSSRILISSVFFSIEFSKYTSGFIEVAACRTRSDKPYLQGGRVGYHVTSRPALLRGI